MGLGKPTRQRGDGGEALAAAWVGLGREAGNDKVGDRCHVQILGQGFQKKIIIGFLGSNGDYAPTCTFFG